MDALRSFTGSGTLDVAMEDKAATQPAYGRQPVGPEAKRAAVHEEIKRVTKLPPTSTYASHRLRVLNKILQLMAIQCRTSSEGFLHGWMDAALVSVPHLVRNVRKIVR